MFACFFSYRTHIYIYIIHNRCNTRVTCSGFKVYIYDVTYVGLSLCIMFCGKLCIQNGFWWKLWKVWETLRIQNHFAFDCQRVITRGQLEELCWESFEIPPLLVVYGPKNLKRHGGLREPFFGFSLGTGMWEIWIYVWGYLIFFGEKKCKMNRNRNKSKVWGVSHPERWSQTFSQRDLWSSFHGRILQCRPATPNRPNRPNGPNGSNGPEDYAGCWGIPSGAGLVGQRLEVPRSIAGQGHWSRVDLASFVEHLVQLMVILMAPKAGI